MSKHLYNLIISCPLFVLLLGFCLTSPVSAQQNQQERYIPQNVYTMSEVLDVLDIISLGVVLEAPVDLEFDRFDNSYLLPLSNYLDFNVIGLGRSGTLFPKRMIEFIIEWLKNGKPLGEIGPLLPEEFQRLEIVSLQEQSNELLELQVDEDQAVERQEPRVHIGGYFVGEVEHLQEPNATWRTRLDLNQVRLYFSARVNPSARTNRLNFLAEWNPVPEKFAHHIDQIIIPGNVPISLINNPVNNKIPFEQLYFEVANIVNSGINFKVGQFRLPFGLWSDITSHRNFSSAKSNTLTNGFALRKIEMGATVQATSNYGLAFLVGIVHGRQTRTTDLDREDIDENKDFVSRLSYVNPLFQLGASAYLGEFKVNRNYAYGGDLVIPSRRLTVSGEFVYQKNNDMPATFGQPLYTFTTSKAISGYLQFDAALTTRMHFYGFYETWRYYIDDNLVNKATYKLFHGFRVIFNPNFRWTVVEYGRMIHNQFDDGKNHIGSILELTF